MQFEMNKIEAHLRKLELLLVVIAFTISGAIAQDHESKDNYTGNWEDAGTWEIGGVPPEPVSKSTQVDIYGTVNRNSLLEVNKDFTLNIYDTLIIYGGFTLQKEGNVNVNPGAYLIVYGDFTSAKDIEIDLESYLVVFGDFELQKDANITTPAGDTLLYTSGTASCVGGCGTVDIGDEDDMFNNPDLDEIIEETSSFITPRSPTLCSGGSLVLSIRDDGTNYNWFDTSAPGITLSTEPTLIITATGTYDVDYDVGGVSQNVDPVIVTSNGTVAFSISSVVTNASGVGLSDGEIDLTVSPVGTYTYDWSNGETTEDLSGLAASDYIVEIEDENCRLTETFSVTDVACTPPNITNTTSGSRCGTGTVNLSAAASAGTINWYDVATGGTAIGTGNNFTTPSINSTTSYYVDATNGGCTTAARTEVIATVNPLPAVAVSATPATICFGESTLLNATGGISYSWSPNLPGEINDQNIQSPTYTPASNPTSPTQYTATFTVVVTDSNSCVNTSTVDIIVNRRPETGPQYHISNQLGN